MPVETVVFSWVQPVNAFAETRLLLNDSEVAAVIRREDVGTTIETAYNKWFLRQVGIIRTTIPVKNSQTGILEAVYKASWSGGGVVQFSQDKKKFTWRANNSKSFEWLDQEGNSWGRFQLEFSKNGKRGFFDITQEILDRNESELLMVLGWYLCISQLGYGGSSFDRIQDGTPGNGGSYPKL